MQEKQLIDGEFYVEEKRWGTYQSYDKNDNGLITSLTEEQCISATRFLLKVRQEEKNGNKADETLKTYSGDVDYKL